MELEKVKGYDVKNYDKKKGIANPAEDKISNEVVEQVMDLILQGYAFNTISHALGDTYHQNSYQTRHIYHCAEKALLEKSRKQSDDIREKQLQRLLTLYRRAVDIGDRTTELNTLKEINKMQNLYVNKVEVSATEYTLDLLGGNSNGVEQS